MSYVFQAILFVFVLACAMMAEAFCSGRRSKESFTHALYKSMGTGIGFIVYAGIDYLMIVPGSNYVMA